MIGRRKFITQISTLALAAGITPTISACKKNKRGFKLGIDDWDLKLSGNPKAVNAAKALGLDGLLISMPFNPPQRNWGSPELIAEFNALFARTNLECASTAAMCNKYPFISTDGAVEYVINTIKGAAAMGAKDILLPFYGNANMQSKKTKRIKEECVKPLIESLKKITPIAEKLGVRIGMENSINADDNLRIIDAVGSPALMVYFDIMNFTYYGFNTVEEMKKLKGHISQIHLKDIGHKLDSNSGKPQNMPLVFDTIREIGYDGWLVFETHGFNPKKTGYSLEDLIKYNIEYVRNSVLFK